MTTVSMSRSQGQAARRKTPRRRDALLPRHPALLMPLLLVFGLCYVLPLLNVIRLSLIGPSGITLSHYADVLGDPFILEVLWRTLKVGATTTLVSALLGYPLGVLLAKTRGLARSLLTYAVLAPLLLSGVVRSFGWFILLRKDGLVSSVMTALGFPGAADGLLFSESAIVVGLVHLFMPMLVIAVSGSVQQLDGRLLSAARGLGAHPIVVFFKITLPLTMPGLLAGALLVFSLSSSAFATPAILGGSTVPVASYLIYQQGLILGHWAAAAALSMLLLTVVASVSLLSLVVGRRYGRRR